MLKYTGPFVLSIFIKKIKIETVLSYDGLNSAHVDY